ncbi:hypothetical protein [Tessaracoccus sp.]
MLSDLFQTLKGEMARNRAREIERQGRRLIDLIEPGPRPVRDRT